MWEILGVPPGTDRDTVRRAYARKLRATHPEDDPEGFKALRAAYEVALAQADHAATWGAFDFSEDENEAAPGADGDADGDADGEGDADGDDDGHDDGDSYGDGNEDGRAWHGIDAKRPGPIPDWRAAAPLPDAADDAAIAAVLAGRDAELAELRTLMAALEAGLRGPWRDSDATLEHRLAAILDAPALGEIGIRTDIAPWLADLLVETIPYSDAVLRQSIDAFGWSDDRQGGYDHSVARVLQRLDEWRIIAALNHHGHDYHAGWRSLTGPPGNALLWRIDALRPGVARGAAALLGEFGPVSPGLHHSFNAASVERWQAFLARPRLTAGMLLQVPVLAMALCWLGYALAGASPTPPGMAAVAALAALGPVVSLFALAPARRRWRDRVDPPRWQRDGWPFVFMAACLLAMLMPGGWPVLIAAPALLVAAWAYVVRRPAPARKFQLGGGDAALIVMLFLSSAFIGELTPAQGFALTAAAATLAYLRVAQWGDAGDVLQDRLGRWREWIILGGTVVILASGFGVLAWRAAWAPVLPFYPIALCILALALPIGAPSRADGPPRLISALLLALSFLTAGIMMPDKPREPYVASGNVPLAAGGPADEAQGNVLFDSGSTARGLAAMAQAQPGFALVRTFNPPLYAALSREIDRFHDGQATRAQAMAAFTKLIDDEYRARLPKTNAALLVEGQIIRLSVLEALQAADVAACADEGDRAFDAGLLPKAVRDRQNAQVFNVIANPPAIVPSIADGTAIPSGLLLSRAAAARGISAIDLTAQLDGKQGPAPRCDARIALLKQLLNAPRADAAATLRAEMRAVRARQAIGPRP